MVVNHLAIPVRICLHFEKEKQFSDKTIEELLFFLREKIARAIEEIESDVQVIHVNNITPLVQKGNGNATRDEEVVSK